jgi:hypothetical protein
MRISTSAMGSAFDLLEGDEAAAALAEHDEIVEGKRAAAREARASGSAKVKPAGNGRRKPKPADTE